MASRSQRYASALLDTLAATAPKEHVACLDRFVALLREERALALAPTILTAIAAEAHDRERRATARVTFASPPTATTTKHFERFAPFEVSQDRALIAGFNVRRQDRLIDASAQGQLETMRRALASA